MSDKMARLLVCESKKPIVAQAKCKGNNGLCAIFIKWGYVNASMAN